MGDVTRLRQVLLNLLCNAVKFTERGEVVVSVGARPLGGADALQELSVSVRDTGIGIPADRIGRLFQSFSQVDASTTRRYGGTGLGLAISQRLTELMGGRIEVTSDFGVGSEFRFTIRAAAAEPPAAEPRRDLSGIQPSLRGKAVLVVDDNATNRRILGAHLDAWGMRIRASASPLEALGWIAAGERFDAGILDMHMPDMDGVALARAMRGHPAGAALPLVLFTSLGRREARAEEEGFAAYLHKPIKPSQLFDTLMAVVADRAVHVSPRGAGRSELDPDTARRHPLRILLAEDNVVNQKVALRLLGQMGYRADMAANGLEAIDAVARQTLRRRAHGRADARDGRLRGLARDQPPLAGGSAPADRGHDRQRDAGRPRALHGGGHGRLRGQADPRRGAGRRARTLPATGGRGGAEPPAETASPPPGRTAGPGAATPRRRSSASRSTSSSTPWARPSWPSSSTPSWKTAARSSPRSGRARRRRTWTPSVAPRTPSSRTRETLGAGRLAVLARELEAMARAGTLDGVDRALEPVAARVRRGRPRPRGGPPWPHRVASSPATSSSSTTTASTACCSGARSSSSATPSRSPRTGGRPSTCCAERPVDLVLLDIEMPEMDGYQVLEALAADPRLREVPVVMMSSVEEVDSVARCIELGAEDYLFKPVNPVLLRARVAASLEKKRLRDMQRGAVPEVRHRGGGRRAPDDGPGAGRQALPTVRARALPWTPA